LVGVGRGLPGGQFGVESVEVGDLTGEALAGQAGQFDFGDVEPGPVFGGVVDLDALGEGVGFGGRECLIQAGHTVGVEVVHHEQDLLRVGVVDGEELVELTGPVDPSAVFERVDAPPSGQGFGPQEDRARATPGVFAADTGGVCEVGFLLPVSRCHRDRVADLAEELEGFLVHHDHRP